MFGYFKAALIAHHTGAARTTTSHTDRQLDKSNGKTLWSSIIESVRAPLSFYVLSLLFTEFILFGMVGALSQDNWFRWASFALATIWMFFVGGAVTLFTWKKPKNRSKKG